MSSLECSYFDSSARCLDCFVFDYISINKSDLISFLRERGVELVEISEEKFLQAEFIGKGISGAKKIVLDGKDYVIKRQELTEEFRKNLAYVFLRNIPISHSLVSESDDSFADFPRKEILGARIASAFGIEVPRTELVSINGTEVGSLQEYLPQEKAVAMVDRVQKLIPADIDLQSAVNVIFFHVVTENIDGHCGNVLLASADQNQEDEDDYNPDFKAIPIDFGLIFPRRESVYPNEMNLVKKDFFKFFQEKKISIEENLRPLVFDDDVLHRPEVRSIAKDHELRLLSTNFRAMQGIALESKGRITVRELFDKFISRLVVARVQEA